MSEPRNPVPGGMVDDPGELRTDDFGLDGDLRGQLLTALEKRWNPDDPGATELPEDDDSADTAAMPVPATDSTTEDLSPPGGEGAGEARDTETEGEAAVPVPDDTAPPGTPFDAGGYFNEFFGRPLSREESADLARMISGLQALTPDQKAELDRALSQGQPYQYPATQGQPPAQQYTPPQQPGQSDDPAVAILGPRPDDEYAAQQWDMTAAATRATHAEMEQLRANIAQNTQAELERQRAQTVSQVEAAQSQWRGQYPILTDAEFDALTVRAERSGTFPALVHAHNGDVAAATSALYEQQFWADPTFRDRAIANVASGRQAGDHTTPDPNSPVAQDQKATDTGRQALASSVAGGGGSVTPQTSSIPTEPDKKRQAMVQELASQHDFT